MWLVITEVPPC